MNRLCLDSILQQAREQWRGAAPADDDDALNSIGRQQVGAAKDDYKNNLMC
jgi:hypothetical protein